MRRSQKKKGKEKGKKEKEKEKDAAEAQEDKGDKGENPEKPDKAEKKKEKTKDGKVVKASKAKSKSKKAAGASKKEDPKAADLRVDVPDVPVADVADVPDSPREPRSLQKKKTEPELAAEQVAKVTKSVEVLKDLVARKSESKELKSAKSRDLSEKTKKEKRKKKTKKKNPLKSDHGEYQEWQLKVSEWCNHDCLRMTFNCKGRPSKDFESSIWHIDLAANLGDDGEEIQRSYTPYSTAEEYKKGILSLLIKVYPHGRMSSYLGKMTSGDTILVSNPVATVDPAEYPEGGIMVAGGSAVVVALQVIKAMLPTITDSFHLYLCNRKQEDVLLMTEFNELMEAYPNFHMTNCLSQDKTPESPKGRSLWAGRLTAEMLKSAPSNLKVMISGPDPLCKMVALTFLELGKQEDDIVCLDTDLDQFLHPEEAEDDAVLSRTRTQPLGEPKVESRPPVDVPRARIKAAQSMIISIDSIVSSSPRISRPQPVSGLGLFSSFFCGCRSTDASTEGSEDRVLQKV